MSRRISGRTSAVHAARRYLVCGYGTRVSREFAAAPRSKTEFAAAEAVVAGGAAAGDVDIPRRPELRTKTAFVAGVLSRRTRTTGLDGSSRSA